MSDTEILHIVSQIAVLRNEQCKKCNKCFGEEACKVCHKMDEKIDELVKEIVARTPPCNID